MKAMVVICVSGIIAGSCPAADATQWWERGQADWHYKDDWEYEFVAGDPVVAVELDEPAVSAWAQVWAATRGKPCEFFVNGVPAGSDCDPGTIENYDITALMRVGTNEIRLVSRAQQCVFEGGAELASGKIVSFGTGRPKRETNGEGSYTRTAGPFGYGGDIHMARPPAFTPEQRGKAAINDLLARANRIRLGDASVFYKLLDPADMLGEDCSFAEKTWLGLEADAASVAETARQLAPFQKQGQYERVIEGVKELDSRMLGIETRRDALLAALELRAAARALALQRPMLPGDGLPDIAEELSAAADALRRVWTLMESGIYGSALVCARGGLDKIRLARELIEQFTGFPLDSLNRSSRNRLGWVISTEPTDNNPVFWEFTTAPPGANYIPLAGLWRFSLDPEEAGGGQGWQNAEFDDSAWALIYAPGKWGYERAGYTNDNLNARGRDQHRTGTIAGLNPYNGASWYRKRLVIPGAWLGRDLTLKLGGRGNNAAWVYLNGGLVNDAASADKGLFDAEIRIPAGMARFGETNLLVIRNYDHGGAGGLASPELALMPAGVSPEFFQTRVGPALMRQDVFQIDGHRHRQRILASALSPGIVWVETGGVIVLWGWAQRGYREPRFMAYADGGIVKTLALKPGEVLRVTPGMEQWFLLWCDEPGPISPRPVMLALETAPESVRCAADPSGGLAVEFVSGAAVTRAFAARPFDELPPGAIGPEEAERCRLWANAGYPVAFAEVCWFEGQTCRVRQAFEYLNLGPAPEGAARMAPLPMLFSYALERGWPDAEIAGAALNLGCKARCGWYPNSDCGDYTALMGTNRVEYSFARLEPRRRLMGVGEFINGLDFGEKEFPILRSWGMNSTRPAYHFDEKWEVPGFIQFDEKSVPVPQSGLVGGKVEFEPGIAAKLLAKLERHARHGVTCILCWFSNDTAQYPKSDSEGFSTRTRRAYPGSREIPIRFWGEMARLCAGLPDDALVYDLFNEPSYSHNDEYYRLVRDCIAAIREHDTLHPVSVEAGNSWADIQEFDNIPLFDDEKIIYQFHGYGPHSGDKFRHSLYYPGNYGAYDQWEERLLPVIRFRIRTRADILHGEFGASFLGPDESPRRWLEDVLAVHEKYRFGWNWWTWSGSDIYRTGLWAGERVNPLAGTLAEFARHPPPER